MAVPVGMEVLGHMVDVLGNPIDNRGPLGTSDNISVVMFSNDKLTKEGDVAKRTGDIVAVTVAVPQ